MKYHNWHIVTLSPWPLLLAFDLVILPIGLVLFFQGYTNGLFIFFFGFIFFLAILYNWFRDIIIEGTMEGFHTVNVKKSIVIIVLWFIFSEVMFFFAFFWAYFHAYISPTHELGLVWPPKGCASLLIEPLEFPLLNTLLLLYSGCTLTLVHHYLKLNDVVDVLDENENHRKDIIENFLRTICAGLIFMLIQGLEYFTANFNISYNVWGTTFYMCTGFHGFHVIVGLIFLSVMFGRFYFRHFTQTRHIGFEAAAWYWHFVDVVWIFLFFAIYLFGSLGTIYAPFALISSL